MKIRLLFIGFILFLFTRNFRAQSPWQYTDSIIPKYEWIYGLDNRRTHIQEQSTLIYGAYTGLGIKETYRFKLGISGTPFEIGKQVDLNDHLIRNRLVFMNIGNEFDFYAYRRIKVTAYSQIGWGFNFQRTLDELENVINEEQKTIIPLEIGTHANYFIFPWLALKVGGGWRWMLAEMGNDLSGYYLKLAFGFSTRKFLTSYRYWKANRQLH